MRRVLFGEGFGEGDARGACDRGGNRARARSLATRGGDVDDAPAALCFHVGYGGADAMDRAHKLEFNIGCPDFVGSRLKGVRGGRSGVVDEDVDAAPEGNGLCKEFLDLLRLGHVGGNGENLATRLGADLCRGLFQHFGAARTDDDLRSLARQGDCRGFADAVAAPSDDGNFSL